MAERRPGWLRLHRRAMDDSDPFWRETPFGRWRARLDLIGLAAFRRRSIRVDGDQVTLERGQFFASLSFFARRWGWSTKQVRGFLARLQGDGFLSAPIHRHRLGTVYQVENYDHYQRAEGDQERQV